MPASRLILLGLMTAAVGPAGCVPVPGSQRPSDGSMPPGEKIGTSGRKPLRLHESGRDRVVAVLGLPDYLTADGRVMLYAYDVVSWWEVYVYLFGVGAYPHTSERYLGLRFDPAGTLERRDVYADVRTAEARLGRGEMLNYGRYVAASGAPRGQTPLPPLARPGNL